MDPVFESLLGVSATADSNQAPQAMAAKALPADFVFAVRETAYTTLMEWLEAAGVPAEVKSLLSGYGCLAIPEFADLDTVGRAAQDIAALGGAFDGPSTSGISHVKEHAQAWAANRK